MLMSETSALTKEKIVNNVQKELGLSKAICNELVNTIFDEMSRLIVRDEKLMIHKFGTWNVKYKDERPGFNIHKGDAVKIPSRRVLQFKSCKILRDTLNGHQAE